MTGLCFAEESIVYFVGKAMCKYWGERLMNTNAITEKLRVDLTQGMSCYYSAQNPLPSVCYPKI
jgi:hypothetical protein